MRKLVEGMIALGLLQGNAGGAHRRRLVQEVLHAPHQPLAGHGRARRGRLPRGRRLPARSPPGNVITVEPGLYVAADDAGAPAELRGIGIRIEDDILVTTDGHENLTAAVPKLPDEVELCCTR